ncbi:MAG: maleylpyruvate isomerase family mycothiol-dependent enzyme [Actinomycetales bacterium]
MSADTSEFDRLVQAWHTSVGDIQQVAETLTEAQWHQPTACPGWCVADVVAHVIDAESMIAGEPRVEHVPDWGALPHVASDFGRMTEVGVDARRGTSPATLLAELDRVVGLRVAQLAEGPRDLDAEVTAFTASTLPLGRLLTMRTFDTWVHSQDIRDAVGQPGGLGSPGAAVSADLMVTALPRIWGKAAGAPVGAVLQVVITGPVIERRVAIEVMPDGRAALAWEADLDRSSPTVLLRGSWPAVAHLMTGRTQYREASPEELQFTGDAELIARLGPVLNIAP